jgi:hypothetical protein
MQTRECLSINTSPRFPVVVKPKEYPSKGYPSKEYAFEVPFGYWLPIFVTTCFTLYVSIQNFFSTGRSWPAIFILLILLLLLGLWLRTKQRRDYESTDQIERGKNVLLR